MVVFLAIPLTLAGWIVTITLRCVKNKSLCLYRAHKKAEELFVFSFFLRIVMVTYLAFCVSANYGALLAIDNHEGINWYFTVYVAFVIYVVYTAIDWTEGLELEHSDIKAVYGPIYQGINTKNWSTIK